MARYIPMDNDNDYYHEDLREHEEYTCPVCGDRMLYSYGTLRCDSCEDDCGIFFPYDYYFASDPMSYWSNEKYTCPVCGSDLYLHGKDLRCLDCGFRCHVVNYGSDMMYFDAGIIDMCKN